MILKVAKLGVKTLRSVSQDVDPKAVSRGDYEAFLSDLEDTMREYDGTGIAAPQVFLQRGAVLHVGLARGPPVLLAAVRGDLEDRVALAQPNGAERDPDCPHLVGPAVNNGQDLLWRRVGG